MKKISILGSTGSIGTQTLNVIENSSDFEVTALAAGKNVHLLEEQIRKFRPQFAAVYDEEAAKSLRLSVRDTNTKVFSGLEGIRHIASESKAETTVTAMVGNIGILPTLDAMKSGSHIALANKETMVCAGHLVREASRKYNVKILPVDSEHSAVFQCIGDKQKDVKRIFLTASGGPFFGKKKHELSEVSVKQALKHPNWSMGAKISIDSATMMNKGLEVIEAVQLFNVSDEQIKVVIHRQSIVHSMVEFKNNSILGQIGYPDMRIPIGIALSYPDCKPTPTKAMDFEDMMTLTFEKPDYKTFGCLRLGYEAAKKGGSMTTAYNSAGEEAVNLFLREKCRFLQIEELVAETMNAHKMVSNPDLACIMETDKWAREHVTNLWERKQK